MLNLRRAAVMAAMAAAALAADPAAAADKPVPCNGKPLATDPTGDAFVGFVGLAESPVPAGPNTDYTSLFINNVAGKHTVHFSVADLETTVPPDATAIVYRMNYEVGATTNYLQATIDSAGTVTYVYGHSETAGLVKDGDTTGALFEGPEGVIAIELPASHAGKMSGIDVFSAYVRGRVNTQADQMPDGDSEASYNNALCPGGATPPPSGDGGGSTPPPASSPPPSSPPSSQPSPTAALTVTASPSKLKLKTVNKKRKAAFKLASKEDLSNVAIALRKGSKVVGSAKLARLGRSAKVTLKLKGKLKKGAYSLVVTGRRADGSTGSVVIKIRAA